MQLYTEQDIRNAKRALSIRLMILGIILAVTIALMVVFMTVARNQIATIILATVGMCIAYAFLTIKLMPWFRYTRYLKDMRTGRSNVTEAWFVSCSDSTKISDGVAFHEFVVRVGEGEDDERLFFWDDDKQLPALSEGQKIRIRAFGNYIMELDV